MEPLRDPVTPSSISSTYANTEETDLLHEKIDLLNATTESVLDKLEQTLEEQIDMQQVGEEISITQLEIAEKQADIAAAQYRGKLLEAQIKRKIALANEEALAVEEKERFLSAGALDLLDQQGDSAHRLQVIAKRQEETEENFSNLEDDFSGLWEAAQAMEAQKNAMKRQAKNIERMQDRIESRQSLESEHSRKPQPRKQKNTTTSYPAAIFGYLISFAATKFLSGCIWVVDAVGKPKIQNQTNKDLNL